MCINKNKNNYVFYYCITEHIDTFLSANAFKMMKIHDRLYGVENKKTLFVFCGFKYIFFIS